MAKKTTNSEKQFIVLSTDIGDELNGTTQVIGKYKTRQGAERAIKDEAESYWCELEEMYGDACYQIWNIEGGYVTMASDDGNYGARFTIHKI